MLTTDEFNGEDILIDESQDVASQVEVHSMMDKLRSCIAVLTEDEQVLIRVLFYEGKTERGIAENDRVSQVAIHKRKHRILGKLRKLFRKIYNDCNRDIVQSAKLELKFFGFLNITQLPIR